MTILTNAKGEPFRKPSRDEFSSAEEFITAYYAYKDAITKCANEAFTDAVRREMKS